MAGYWDEKGRLILGPPYSPVYTDRRHLSGDGWALEMNTCTLCGDPAKRPERRYQIETAKLVEFDPVQEKIRNWLEWSNPSSTRRVADVAKL